jgi:hypothetical protein
VTELRKILGARILAQHLQHGIAWDDMDQQKYHCED